MAADTATIVATTTVNHVATTKLASALATTPTSNFVVTLLSKPQFLLLHYFTRFYASLALTNMVAGVANRIDANEVGERYHCRRCNCVRTDIRYEEDYLCNCVVCRNR